MNDCARPVRKNSGARAGNSIAITLPLKVNPFSRIGKFSSTNPIERPNGEIEARTNVVGLPFRPAYSRKAGAAGARKLRPPARE